MQLDIWLLCCVFCTWAVSCCRCMLHTSTGLISTVACTRSTTLKGCYAVQRAAAPETHNVTPDLETTDAYAELVKLAVEKDPSLSQLASQHLQQPPRNTPPVAQPPIAQPPVVPQQSKAPWLRCAGLHIAESTERLTKVADCL